MGTIYKIENQINNKIYIGLTTKPIEQRWKQHRKLAEDGEGFAIHAAIRKYGIDNFTFEVLEECDNGELPKWERFYIHKYDSVAPYGYNLTYGGEGVTKYPDEDFIELWAYGYSAIQISRILGIGPYDCGKRLAVLVGEEAILQRKADNASVAVCQYDINGNYIRTWNSQTQAEKELNISTGAISRCCSGVRKIANGFLWKKADNTEITGLDLARNYAACTSCHEVEVLDMDGELIDIIPSCSEALKYGCDKREVSRICNYEYGRISAHGYRFQWHSELKRQIKKEKANVN